MLLQTQLDLEWKMLHSRALRSCCLLALWVAVAVVTGAASGCGQPSGSPSPVTVNGTEHLTWDQAVPNGTDPASYEFVSYVDGVARPLSDAACSGVAQVGCSASLPPMSAGAHLLTLTAVLESNGVRLESPMSAPLDLLVVPGSHVVVTGGHAASVRVGPQTVVNSAGDTRLSTGGARFVVQTLASGLDSPSSLAPTPDGRVLVADRSGAIWVWQGDSVQSSPSFRAADAAIGADVGLLGLALDPDFSKTGRVYLAYTARSVDGTLTNRVVRFREVNNILGQAAAILSDPVAVSPRRTPRIRFGADGKLYVVFPGDPAAARDPASYVGKILRLNDDGTIPRDNPRYSPIISGDQAEPFAFDWQPATGQLWQVEHDWSDRETVTRLDASGESRSPALSFNPAIDPSAASFYGGSSIAGFSGDLFVAALNGRHVERVRFDPSDPGRVSTTERLLDGEFGRIGDIVAGSDGALYLCTSNRGAMDGQPAAADDRLLRIAPLRATASAVTVR
jgi:glucose/arabinose dehydrogenase